tara:strand:- start:4691 stop:4894 length:204 start_codon:yes stop_codon:yes gene_type:complete
MLYTLKKENPGSYKVKVNNTHRYNIKKTSGDKWIQSWEVVDLLDNKKFSDFVSLSECKEFINEEIFN